MTSKPVSHAEDVSAKLPYFAGLDARALAEIARRVRWRTYAPGEQIVTEGEPCHGLYFVIEGQVRLIKISADGREHVSRVLGPGGTFNDVAVFDGGPNSDSAVAFERSVVGMVPESEVTALVAKHPEVAKAALKHLSARHRRLGVVVEDLVLRDVTARVARLLLGCLGRHEHIVEHAPNACAQITHQEIAAMVGSVREVVQRVLKQLERAGAIAIERRRIQIRDPAKLEAIAHAAE